MYTKLTRQIKKYKREYKWNLHLYKNSVCQEGYTNHTHNWLRRVKASQFPIDCTKERLQFYIT